jgi:hypothetical protein
MVLVTCVPCESWSCSHLFGCSATVPLSEPVKERAYAAATRASGK